MILDKKLIGLPLFAGITLLISGCGGATSGHKKRPKEAPAATQAAAAATRVEKKPIDKTKLGSIKVIVKYEGDPKKNKKIKMTADPACESAHAKGARQEKFLRNDNMTMANAVVYLKDGWQGWQVEKAVGSVVLNQKGCTYVPHVLTAQTKQEIEFKNSDATLHNVHPTPKKNKAFNKATPAHGSVKKSFRRDEIGIPVKCDVHPWMKSYISVFKHPWHAVTPKGDGAATLKDVPEGKYKVTAWHEALGTAKEMEVEVKVGQTAEVTLSF
jgi:plastocyanin